MIVRTRNTGSSRDFR